MILSLGLFGLVLTLMAGIAVGYVLRSRRSVDLKKVTFGVILLLIFSLGFSIGSNASLLDSFPKVGINATVIMLLAVAFSVVFVSVGALHYNCVQVAAVKVGAGQQLGFFDVEVTSVQQTFSLSFDQHHGASRSVSSVQQLETHVAQRFLGAEVHVFVASHHGLQLKVLERQIVAGQVNEILDKKLS